MPDKNKELFSEMTNEKKAQIISGLAYMLVIIEGRNRKSIRPASIGLLPSLFFMFLSICLTITTLSLPGIILAGYFKHDTYLLSLTFCMNMTIGVFAATPLNQFILLGIELLLLKTIKKTLYGL